MAIISEEVGDIFDSPPNSILIHACNAKGVWGSGVAVAFRKLAGFSYPSHQPILTPFKFPQAYKIYHDHCLTKGRAEPLVGTTLLIPPQKSGTVSSRKDDRYVACLFTSYGYGKTVDPPETILKNTRAASKDLMQQIETLKAKAGIEMGECKAVRINSGRFGVPWAQTKKILEEGELDMVVVRPEGEGEGVHEAVPQTKKVLKDEQSSKERAEAGEDTEDPTEQIKDGRRESLRETPDNLSEGNEDENEDSSGGRRAKRRRIRGPL